VTLRANSLTSRPFAPTHLIWSTAGQGRPRGWWGSASRPIQKSWVTRSGRDSGKRPRWPRRRSHHGLVMQTAGYRQYWQRNGRILQTWR